MATEVPSTHAQHTEGAFPCTPFRLSARSSTGIYREVTALSIFVLPCQCFCYELTRLFRQGWALRDSHFLLLSFTDTHREGGIWPHASFNPNSVIFCSLEILVYASLGGQPAPGADGWGLVERVEMCFGGKLRELVLLNHCGGG